MGQGPGPLGQGAGAPGPKLQDTHGKCNYLLSGRLPTVRQTTYCQANYLLSKLGAVTHGESNCLLSGRLLQAGYLLSGRLTAVVKDAPKRRMLCTRKSPHTCTRFPTFLAIHQRNAIWSETYLEVFLWSLGGMGNPYLVYFKFRLVPTGIFRNAIGSSNCL